jgi:hypothetical protein
MTTPANTSTTFTAGNLKQDLEDVFENISPTDRPLTKALGKPGTAKGVTHEWTESGLAAPNPANAAIEGADASNSSPNTGLSKSNIAQLVEKVAAVTSTAESVDGAGNLQTMAVQLAMKTEELALDVEAALLYNNHAIPGSSTIAPMAASLPTFLMTNVSRGAGGANATLSGGSTGYPNTAAIDGTQRLLSELLFANVLQSAWTVGGKPTLAFMGGTAKVKFSGFSGNATKFKDASDKKVVGAVDVYVSDFGEIRAVPSRNIRARDMVIIDPTKAQLMWLQKPQNKELAKTGHSDRRLVFAQFTLKVHTEKAHAGIFDLTP